MNIALKRSHLLQTDNYLALRQSFKTISRPNFFLGLEFKKTFFDSLMQKWVGQKRPISQSAVRSVAHLKLDSFRSVENISFIDENASS